MSAHGSGLLGAVCGACAGEGAQGAAGEDLGQVGAVGGAGVLVAEQGDTAGGRPGLRRDLRRGRGQRLRGGDGALEQGLRPPGRGRGAERFR